MKQRINVDRTTIPPSGKSLHPLQNYDGHMNTYSGIKFNIFNPKPEQITIEDIARGLSNKGHFAGHSPKFFSIAQHSLLVLRLYRNNNKHSFDKSTALMALLHDAPESYIGDMIKPIKIHFPLFSEIEDRIMNVICQKYEIDFSLMTRIKEYDLEAQSLEYDAFYKKIGTFFYMQPDMAYTVFLQEFEELINS